MHNRDMYRTIWAELIGQKSMVFLSGPRQSGKTTLAKMIAGSYINSLYFNWDIPDQRKDLIKNPYFFERVRRRDSTVPLIIFDEIHKFSDWKNYLKGIYDKFSRDYQFLVSGSGRLDIYQHGGDSLAGRYLLFHLWPFTLAELTDKRTTIREFVDNPLRTTSNDNAAALWKRLSIVSGFPEPYLTNRVQSYNRWSTNYSRQLIREDIRDLSGVKSVYEMETLYHLIPEKIGSSLSIPSLARDLKVAYNTVNSWLKLFERFYLSFSITPWTSKIARAIQKEKKVYLWDTPRISNEACRLENMVGLELYRAVTLWNDMGYGRFSLHFIRDKEKREVDFLVANGRKPFFLVETKLAQTSPSENLIRFQQILDIPAIQLVNSGKSYELIKQGNNKVLIAPAYMWLPLLV